MLRDPAEAEDALQDVFIQLFRKIHTFRGESAFSSWLHRLTANVVLMRLRRKKLKSVSLDEIVEGDDHEGKSLREIAGPDLRLSGLPDRLTLQAAVDQLPEGYRQIFILHDARVTSTARSPQSVDAQLGIRSPSYTRPACDCANCSAGQGRSQARKNHL